MGHIPKPLFQRLLLTFLTGGSSFLVGLIFFLRKGDMSSCVKGTHLLFLVRKEAYTMLEGICTDVRRNLLGDTQNICLVDAAGNRHCLVIGKGHKIRTGLPYRFYFRNANSIPPDRTPLLRKAFLMDSLLGVEEMK